jgi:GNAT superfamily N-acetyltransferase
LRVGRDWLYAASYGLSFDIDAMVASDIEDRAKFYPPNGRFYVIRRAGAYVGVGCLKRITLSVAEIQRMYVQPHVRGVGAGRLLLQQLLSEVRLQQCRILSHVRALPGSARPCPRVKAVARDSSRHP